MKLIYDGKVIGSITTNQSLSIEDACELLGIDPSDTAEYDYELFAIEYDSYAMTLGYTQDAIELLKALAVEGGLDVGDDWAERGNQIWDDLSNQVWDGWDSSVDIYNAAATGDPEAMITIRTDWAHTCPGFKAIK